MKGVANGKGEVEGMKVKRELCNERDSPVGAPESNENASKKSCLREFGVNYSCEETLFV